MKRFNVVKEQRKLNKKINLANNIKIRTIILSIFVLVGSIMLFTYSKYSTSVKLDIMHSKVANFLQDDYIINAYVDGDKDDFPGKDDGYYVDEVVCNKGATGTWDDDEWGLLITGADEEETECNIYFKTLQTVFDFPFDPDNDGNGQEQNFTTPLNGIYKLEVWGAQGGGGVNSGNNYIGGYGAYAVGTINLNKNDVLKINVGGKGVCGNNTTTSINQGGYNGGGVARADAGYITCSGGGATHIATVSGLLNALSSYKNTGGTNISNEIIIVAGGGGGAAYSRVGDIGTGGSGGGKNGSKGTTNATTSIYTTGGTQTTGGCYYTSNSSYNTCNGTFGQGANLLNYQGQYHGGAGGGGWYGGGATTYDYSAGGGGGSGYIASSKLISSNNITKKMVCYNCSTSTDSDTNTDVNTCHNSNANENCNKEDNGYARITLVKRL